MKNLLLVFSFVSCTISAQKFFFNESIQYQSESKKDEVVLNVTTFLNTNSEDYYLYISDNMIRLFDYKNNKIHVFNEKEFKNNKTFVYQHSYNHLSLDKFKKNAFEILQLSNNNYEIRWKENGFENIIKLQILPSEKDILNFYPIDISIKEREDIFNALKQKFNLKTRSALFKRD